MRKILLVEDDALLNKTLTYNLISEGYDTVSALNAGAAMTCAGASSRRTPTRW